MKILPFIVLLAVAPTAPPMLVAQARTLVATSNFFVFHSEPLFGLHDFLNWRTSVRDSVPGGACRERIAPDAKAAFERAEQFYRALQGQPRNRFLIAMRYEVAGFPGLGIVADSITSRAHALLRAALPAYRTCWWPEHDRRNRAWIAEVLPRLNRHEDSIKARLARAYQAEWDPGRIPVDVVSFATFTGAHTVTQPHHIIVSAVDSSYRGDAALEMLFHEASHTIVDSGRDNIRRALRDSTLVGTTPPRELSHVLLFYTAGRITQGRLAEVGSAYEPYLYSEGLFRRAWPQYQAAVERYWQPYLDGRTDARSAIREIVRAMAPR
jgi:hypothetical protein